MKNKENTNNSTVRITLLIITVIIIILLLLRSCSKGSADNNTVSTVTEPNVVEMAVDKSQEELVQESEVHPTGTYPTENLSTVAMTREDSSHEEQTQKQPAQNQPIYIEPVVFVKQNPSVTAPTAVSDLKYSALSQPLINAGSTTGGTLQYALGNESQPTSDYSTDIPQATNAGQYYIWYRVVGDSNFNDVAERLLTAMTSKRCITLTSGSSEKIYDGTALTNGDVEVSGDGFADGEGADFLVTGSQTDAGTDKNTFSYELAEGTALCNYEITVVEGDLTVNKRNISLTSGSDSKKYDGKKLTNNNVSVSGDGFIGDQGFSIYHATGSQTDAGEISNTIEYELKGNTNPDNYNIEAVEGDLTVEKRTIVFALADGQVTEIEALSDGFVKDEGVTYTVTGPTTVEYNFDENTNPDNYDMQMAQACFPAGTKITMADGSNMNIEDISEGDIVLTFSHEKGAYEPQKVYLAYKGDCLGAAFTLHFDNGTELSIVGEHDLFEKESLKYVMITDEDAQTFIGRHFYCSAEDRYVEPVDVTYGNEEVEFSSLYTEYNANCIANGMLSVPDDSDEILNIYDFNENLSIDHNQLLKDIEEYGLYTYTPNAEYSREMFDAYGWKYISLIIGKGYGTMDEFTTRRDDFLAGNF